jgi:hypothetical protein
MTTAPHARKEDGEARDKPRPPAAAVTQITSEVACGASGQGCAPAEQRRRQRPLTSPLRPLTSPGASTAWKTAARKICLTKN